MNKQVTKSKVLSTLKTTRLLTTYFLALFYKVHVCNLFLIYTILNVIALLIHYIKEIDLKRCNIFINRLFFTNITQKLTQFVIPLKFQNFGLKRGHISVTNAWDFKKNSTG